MIRVRAKSCCSRGRLARWVLACCASWAAGLGAAPLAVRAESSTDLVAKTMEISSGSDGLALSFDAGEFGSASVRRKLRTGLPQNIVVRAVTYYEQGGDPVAATAQSCRVVYDLWEGIYRVQQQLPGREHSLEFSDPGEVLKACLRLDHLPFARDSFGGLRGKRVYCAVFVELNPVSQAMIERIRRWLSRSSSGNGSALRGDAFFGSFVSIFVGRDIGRAERSAAYRSQPWVVP